MKSVSIFLPRSKRVITITKLEINKDDDQVLDIEYDIHLYKDEKELTIDDLNTEELQKEVGDIIEEAIINHVNKLEKEK